MSADWDEVKRLAADFQRAQLSSTIQKLSERNCIEIVKKLIELKLIEVIFTTDGKEYLTPSRLLKEIKDELIVHGGRINLVDLAQIIGVDYSHVETKANEFLNSESNTWMVLGQLITSDYLDHLAEEVNEKLHQVGEITIAEITKLYDLPGDFLTEVIHNRLGTIVHGQADTNDSRTFFTDSYVSQHTARIRGALSAITRPMPLSSIINHFKFPEKLFYCVVEDLINEGRLAGSISGGRSERAIYVPDIYAKSQNEYIDSFFKQNGYLEYDAVARLGILDPKTYLKKKFKELTYFNSCCVGQNILSQIEAAIDEALNTKTWVDILSLLPSVFTQEDIQGIIATVTKSIAKQGSVVHVYCDTIVVSDEFIKSCQQSFEPLMTNKAKDDIANKPHLFTTPQNVQSAQAKKGTPPSKGRQEFKEDKKKKGSSGGKSGSGTGSQGRETKTKNVKRKYFTEKKTDDYGSDEETESQSKPQKLDLEFLSASEVEKHVKSLEQFRDCPDELITDIAVEIHRPLKKKYQEVAKALFESTSAGSSRRKQHADYQNNFTTLLSHILMFEKATELFSEDVCAQLLKHLLKTLCSDLVNMIVNYLAQEHGVAAVQSETSFTIEQRLKIINKFSEDIRQPLIKLHNSLNAKNLEDFHPAVETVLGAGICDMIVRKPDKKKERLVLANHRQSLLTQLSEASEPALCLHVAVLLIFQTHTHNMLHASGKFVPHIIVYLQRQVPFEVYELLATYQELVIKKLTPSDDEEEKKTIETTLVEKMSKIKEVAVTYKKSSISETDPSVH
ncbi:E3 UFM1-protein ligase 1 [Parasteatoda tepidariorum]|uniref:E3 UFM1-protein ligase 1 n=1 Tax=Parasteatoda tepidariorum TaxID=114398 RepID=UPI00077F86EE|nr:E3 UFM1-protein ligase 1 [Parasteatoda tepidariorum]